MCSPRSAGTRTQRPATLTADSRATCSRKQTPPPPCLWSETRAFRAHHDEGCHLARVSEAASLGRSTSNRCRPVAEQPAPMQEWSPYADIAPPHRDGYLKSQRGEFRLIALPGGRTRLEGSTWYEMRIRPSAYWSVFGDAIISRIHARVLRHIRTEVRDFPTS